MRGDKGVEGRAGFGEGSDGGGAEEAFEIIGEREDAAWLQADKGTGAVGKDRGDQKAAWPVRVPRGESLWRSWGARSTGGEHATL